MDARFRYRHRGVHDIKVGRSLVRVWNVEGLTGTAPVVKALKPLFDADFIHPYIALMPDFHPGSGPGVVIGSVIPTRDVILPSVVGGDLGCGMTAVALPLSLQHVGDALAPLFERLAQVVPVGTSFNTSISERVAEHSLWKRSLRSPAFEGRHRGKLRRQFASVGGGNHFLEIQKDGEDRIWVMLHSGSRYLGVLIRDFYVQRGRELRSTDRKRYDRIPYFPADSDVARDYMADMDFAVTYAQESRREMLTRVLEVFRGLFPKPLEGHGLSELLAEADDVAHNYIAIEEHFDEQLFIHRKGATPALEGRTSFIPGSMGTSSYAVKGRSNPYSFCSCSHGAGRAMSRGEAFARIPDRDFERSMDNVVFRYDPRLKDEAPEAYKDIGRVMRSQRDLARIQQELTPLVSLKGA